MQWQMPITIPKPPRQIGYQQPILLIGSCFTEHLGEKLARFKFSVLQNPQGILFDPYSVSDCLISCVQNREYGPADLFYLNELWQSWRHHGDFSNPDPAECLRIIQQAQEEGHAFLRQAKWLIITLGSAFCYRIREGIAGGLPAGNPVANCHRAPAGWFDRQLMPIEGIQAALDGCIHRLSQFNPDLRIIFTVSPVRHARDGIVENNRSKARLLEAVHHLADKFDRIHYFPAYELVIDVLRDYRFYDVDLVHPNYQATQYVFEQFAETWIDEPSRSIMRELEPLLIAAGHRPQHSGSLAHRQFLDDQLVRVRRLQEKYPFLDLNQEQRDFAIQDGS